MTAPTLSADVEAMRQQLQDLRNSLAEAVAEAAGQRRAKNDFFDTLETTRSTLATVREQLTAEKTAHAADVELIGNSLIVETADQEAESVYDDVVNRINYRLDVKLPERIRTYRVRIPITVELEVEATSESDAKEKADDDIRSIESTIDNFDLNTAGSVTSIVSPDYEWDVEDTND